MTNTEPNGIEASLPHRKPMLLLDEVIEHSPDRIRCHKTIQPDEFFLQGHYPDYPIVPGVILCEFAMQAGALLLSEHLANRSGIPVATRMNNVKFKKIVKPGDTIEADVVLVDRLADAFFLKAKVIHEETIAARLDFACTLVSRE